MSTRTEWRRVKWALDHVMPCFQREVADGLLHVMISTDDGALHLSISHQVNGRPGRIPTWDEIAEARYRFTPDDVTMAMILPPRDQYVNIHPTTMHLWQIPGEP